MKKKNILFGTFTVAAAIAGLVSCQKNLKTPVDKAQVASTFFFYFILFSFIFLGFGCSKETLIENFSYAKIKVTYKNFSQAPGVTIQVDDSTLGSLQAGRVREDMILMPDQKIRLSIRRESSGELLIDSLFMPASENNFTIFVTDLLGVAQFYTPPASTVSADSIRIQLLNNIKIQNTGRKISFKFFVPLTTALAGFEELTGYELSNVEYGKLSRAIDIPKLKYPTGPQTVLRPVYIKAYDAITGQLLVDLKTGSTNSNYGNVIATGSYATAGGKYNIINVSVTETAGVPSYVRPFPSYPM